MNDQTKRQANVNTSKLYKKEQEKILRAAGFKSQEWGTKNQWLEAARKVKAGAKSIEIEYVNANGRSWSVFLFNQEQTEPLSRKITGTEEFLKTELQQAKDLAAYWEGKAKEAIDKAKAPENQGNSDNMAESFAEVSKQAGQLFQENRLQRNIIIKLEAQIENLYKELNVYTAENEELKATIENVIEYRRAA